MLLESRPRSTTRSTRWRRSGGAGIPLVILATMATVIASQALITAAFSVTKQAIQLGCLPRMQVHAHFRATTSGRSTFRFINWSLYLLSCWPSCCSGRPTNLASAYGIAVTLDMSITTVHDLLRDPLRLEVPAVAGDAATGPFSSS